MKSAVLSLLVVMTVLLWPSPVGAATCSAYTTQAEAQRAADTRDADGDGILCVISPR